jgi:hypothetical protein
MPRLFSVLLAVLLTSVPSVFAKAPTSKITIKGPDRKLIEITDPKILANFRVWAGPETSSNEARSLIVDWSRGPIAEPSPRLQRYEIDFYVKLPEERLMYVVFYEFDASSRQGYVYLPGKSDNWYSLNVGTIFHEVEGKWFHAWSAWDNLAGPLITEAK